MNNKNILVAGSMVVLLIGVGSGAFWYGKEKGGETKNSGYVSESDVSGNPSPSVSASPNSVPANNSQKISVVVNEASSSVSVMKDQQIVQVIPVDIKGLSALSGEYGTLRKQVFNDIDVNFDGYNDLRIYTDIGYAGVNVYYDFYTFNPVSEKFEKDAVLVSISNPKFELNNREIISEYRSGPQWFKDVYKFDGSVYQKISSGPSF